MKEVVFLRQPPISLANIIQPPDCPDPGSLAAFFLEQFPLFDPENTIDHDQGYVR